LRFSKQSIALLITAQSFTRDKRAQRMISARAKTKPRLSFDAVWLATEVSRFLINSGLKMSIVTPIFDVPIEITKE